MRYKQTDTEYGVYSCPCGKSRSYKYSDTSTSGNPYGDIFYTSIPYNLGDKYSLCGSCQRYWYDGNAREWNEISKTKKFFYLIGFWFLLKITPPWLIFQYIHDEVPDNKLHQFLLSIIAAIIILPLFILYDLFLVAFMLFMNIPFVPIVLIYHLFQIKESKDRIKYGSGNKWMFQAQNKD